MEKFDILKAAGLFIRDKKVLVAKSRDDDRFMNVGGKLMAGESYEEALVREVMEETGISISLGDIRHYISVDGVAFGKNEGKTIHLQAYLITKLEGEPTPLQEILELKWVDSSDVGSIPMASIIEKSIIPKLKKDGLID